MLARSDALLALWDGQPSPGEGGTAGIVAQARELDVPVCLLCVSRGTTQASALKVETIKMPDAVSALSDDAFGKLDWFNRQRPPPSRLFPSEGYPSSGIFARGLHASFARADHIALRMQRLLLTANRALYSLAVVAVAMSAGEVIFLSGHSNIAWVEFATLAVILLALLAARRGRFVERWLSLRYLAERIRSLAFLTPVLGSLGPPIRYIGELDAPLQNPMEEWIRRALDELVLRNPPPTDPNDDLPELKNRLLQEWIYPQLRYQQDVHTAARRRHRRFSIATTSLFGVSLIAAFLQATGLLGESEANYLGFISLVIPSAAAAARGYAAQRDYARQVVRSEVMSSRLRNAAAGVDRAVDLPELRRAAVNVESTLYGEAADWYTAVRLHEPAV
jgi:hypothetical protein